MWFSAAILFRSDTTDHTPGDSLWEESIVLINADTEDDALRIATTIGQGRQHGYDVEGGSQLRWLFDRVERIYAIESENVLSGTELFSRYLRASEVESLLTPFEE